ncbi:MAG: tRNA lysidine(34) synthetase TilS, partial [Congregibacter sp.]|nr:tRNA lysidine(34) synthetase TilS [Congregibacter sp.]
MAQDPVLSALEHHADGLTQARRVCVAFSGGLDSTVLLHAAGRCFAGRVTALHVNHGLQPGAQAWAEHCQTLCAQWKIALESVELQLDDRKRDATRDPGAERADGVEAAARVARYHWFESRLEPGDVLLMAHHQDDQAETLLLRLLRGAGPQGLAAMPVSRSLGRAELLRPFLELPRRDLQAYAAEHALRWIDDPSNQDLRFDRNYLRHAVIPQLEQRWPGYRATLSRSAKQLREQNEHFPGPALDTVHNSFGDPGFALATLPREPTLAALALR